jgi:general secretion pathway protein D
MNLKIFKTKKFNFLIKILFFFYTLETLLLCNAQEAEQKEEQKIILNAQRDYAEKKINLGNEAVLSKNYLMAFNYYQEAVDILEKSKLELTQLYQDALYLLNVNAVFLILEYVIDKKNNEAKRIASIITNKKYYLDYPPKNILLKKISSIRIHKPIELKPEELKKLENILYQGLDFYYHENWDSASHAFHEALHIDPSNDASQIALQLIEQQESNELRFDCSDQETCMINTVNKSWQLPLSNSKNINQIHPNPSIANNIDLIRNKIHQITIPKIEFIDTPFLSAIEEIKNKVLICNNDDNDYNKKGINIVLAFDLKKLNPEPKITLSLIDAPLEEILKYVTQQAHMQVRVDPYSIAIIPENESQEVLVTKNFKVPSSFISQFPAFSPLNRISDKINSPSKIESLSIKDILLSLGITFPSGATAHFLPSKNILVVKNSPTNLNLITLLIENSSSAPLKQVEIEARFLEVKQNVTKERGFNWLLGAFQLGQNLQIGGGKIENKSGYQQSDGLYNSEATVTSTEKNKVESGITAHALETLLFGNPAGSAVGMLTLAGVLTNNQFQVILRAINQHKGVDLLSAPKVTVSSGKKATMRVAREFPYPADYSPPQIPQNQGTSVNPAIPTTPSSFKKRNIGVELEVKPIVDANKNSIELSLSPEIVEFQGFVNYGNPIFSQAPVFLGGIKNVVTSTTNVLLTQNTINQPVFSVREVDTQVVLHDGQTVVLGGLMREDIKKVEEKIPVIGSIPIAGSLFRSSSEQKIKRNLLIFVTVHLLDPSGKSTSQKLNLFQKSKEHHVASEFIPSKEVTKGNQFSKGAQRQSRAKAKESSMSHSIVEA